LHGQYFDVVDETAMNLLLF